MTDTGADKMWARLAAEDPARAARLQRGLKKRYAREGRFKLYGILAVSVAIGFLLLLLGRIIEQGHTAFYANQLTVSVYMDPARIDRAYPQGTNFQQMVAQQQLARLTGVIDKLLVYPDNMRKNLDRLGGLHNSQRVLLALTQAGCSREESYSLVQRNAMRTWEHGEDFLTNLKKDADVTARLSDAELEGMFDEAYHFKHVDTIFARVFGHGKP